MMHAVAHTFKLVKYPHIRTYSSPSPHFTQLQPKLRFSKTNFQFQLNHPQTRFFSTNNNTIDTGKTINVENKTTNETINLSGTCTGNKIEKTNETIVEPQKTGVQQLKYWLEGYASLSKFKLSVLVLSTSVLGYFMGPGAFHLSTFLISTAGVGATICAANSINQIIEVENDSKMNRTKKRWLPTQRISLTHAKIFAVTCGVSGFTSLYYCVNPLSGYLALFNLLLYTSVYTPMKQRHPLNTWVGAVVGAIPPMIGWAADTGGMEMGSWVLAALLGFWQMPHFMALSYSLKDDYHRGGFKMLINTNPDRVKNVILRYSLAMLPIGFFAYIAGMTSWVFAVDSLIPNLVLLYYVQEFYREPSRERALKIFKYSLLLLPLLMGLMLIHKIRDDDDDEFDNDNGDDNEKKIVLIENNK